MLLCSGYSAVLTNPNTRRTFFSSKFIIWKIGGHIIIVHKVIMFCLGIFVQEENGEGGLILCWVIL